MPKKVSIVSAISLILLVGLIAILVKLRPRALPVDLTLPAQVSVLVPEENTILLLSFDEFLTGCIRGLLPRGETPAPEALRAITAAQKTRTICRLRSPQLSTAALGADFIADENFPYTPDNGDAALNEKLRAAVTEAQIITINGEVFDAPICRVSSGRTDPSPYSPSTPLLCDMDSDGFLSRHAFTHEEVWQELKPTRAPADCAEWFDNAVYENTGSLKSIEFCGRAISGEELREHFDLPSRAIIIEFMEDVFYFSCQGQGDNRGMSVNAAVFLASSGYSAEQILALFYPEAEMSRPLT